MFDLVTMAKVKDFIKEKNFSNLVEPVFKDKLTVFIALGIKNTTMYKDLLSQYFKN